MERFWIYGKSQSKYLAIYSSCGNDLMFSVISSWQNIMQKIKYSCFRKCGRRVKSSPGRKQIYFFNRFSGDILFSSLVFFAFFDSCFFVVCLMLFKLNMYILIHNRLCGWVSDKKNFHPANFRKQGFIFFGLSSFN